MNYMLINEFYMIDYCNENFLKIKLNQFVENFCICTFAEENKCNLNAKVNIC